MNIYVTSLNYDVSNEDLKAVFEKYGTVTSSTIITDKENQRSRGFGFVEMPDNQKAELAINELDGSLVGGKAISVMVARDRNQRTNNDNRQSNGFRRDQNKRYTDRW